MEDLRALLFIRDPARDGEWLFLFDADRTRADLEIRVIEEPRTYIFYMDCDLGDAQQTVKDWLLDHTTGKYDLQWSDGGFGVRLTDLNDATLFRLRWV